MVLLSGSSWNEEMSMCTDNSKGRETSALWRGVTVCWHDKGTKHQREWAGGDRRWLSDWLDPEWVRGHGALGMRGSVDMWKSIVVRATRES